MQKSLCVIAALLFVGCGRPNQSLPSQPSSSSLVAPTPAPPPRKFNIVYIVADDLDARAIDNAQSLPGFMPALQGLMVGAGTSFSRAYVSSPLCTPSRVSTLTGRYPHNTGVVSNDDYRPFSRSGNEQATIATMLQQAGYRTVLLGKYMNGYPLAGRAEYVPPGWSEWYVPLITAAYFDYYMNVNGTQIYRGTAEADYVTDVLSQFSADFIRRVSASADRPPFFMYISPPAPHSPALPAPRHGGAFPKLTAPRIPSFDEIDVSDKPGWVQRKPLLDADAERGLDKLYRRRMQSMLAIDDLLANVVRALAETNQLQDTYIFFTSDNGFEIGDHRYTEGKGLPYEESIRVPLIVRGPGVLAGMVRPHLVSQVDFLPTWLELANVTAPKGSEGRSIVPLLGANAMPIDQWRQELLVEFLDPGGPEAPPFHLLRNNEWSYTEYDNGEREMYDMIRDPYQLENVARRASSAVVAPLSRRLEELLQ